MGFVNEENRNSSNEDYSGPDPQRIYVGGEFSFTQDSLPHRSFAVLGPDGNLVPDFLKADQFGITGTGKSVKTIELTDEFIYVGGDFSGYALTIDEMTVSAGYQMIQRYSYIGDLDTSYMPASGLAQNFINTIYPMNNGNLLIGGTFNDFTSPYLTMLDSNGTDLSAPDPISAGGVSVNSIIATEDESLIFLGGDFSDIDVKSGYENYAVLDNSGIAVPANTLIPSITNTGINDLVLTDDGTLYIVGSNGGTGFLKKFDFNGDEFIEDSQFETNFTNDINPNTQFTFLSTVNVDEKGMVYVGGYFKGFVDTNGSEHAGIVRLTTNGYIDPTFQLNFTGANPTVHDIEFQRNGKILIGGLFTYVNGNMNNDDSGNGILRVFRNGEVDSSFEKFAIGDGNDPGPYATVFDIAIQEVPLD